MSQFHKGKTHAPGLKDLQRMLSFYDYDDDDDEDDGFCSEFELGLCKFQSRVYTQKNLSTLSIVNNKQCCCCFLLSLAY
jgi:hypothetical protein